MQTNMVWFLHVSASLMAILREVRYKEWIYRNTAKFCEILDARRVTHLLEDCHKSGRNM